STELRRPSSSAEHRASSRPSSTRMTSIFTASSPQVMHPVTWSQWGFRPSLIVLGSSLRTRGAAAGGRRWRTGCSLDHARFQLLELLFIVGAHSLEQIARRKRLVLIDLRNREADMDQHPVARLGGVAVLVQEPDVDVALDPGDIDLRGPILDVADLDDLAWDRETHQPVNPDPW